MKRLVIRVAFPVVLAAFGWGGYRFVKQLPERHETVATTKVQRGDVVIRAYTRGELRAVRSVTLVAPNLFGTTQVTRLAPLGALARERDLIAEFDESERVAAREQAELNLEQVDEQIKMTKANQQVTAKQDSVNLIHARYEVRRAELDVQKNPILAEIDAKKNVLTLEQDKRALAQLESDVQSRQQQFQAQLAALAEQRNAAQINVQREVQRIAQTKVLSPITGLVAIRQNRSGYYNFGQTLPDIREGDTLQPGMPIADVLDLSELEVVAKVGELDRANLMEGQEVRLQLDAIADKHFHGKIKSLSGTASSDVFSGDPAKKFDVVFSIDMRELLSGLGMKPAEIDRIMATAAQNAKRVLSNPSGGLLGGGRADPGGPGRGGFRADSPLDFASGGVSGAGGGFPALPGSFDPGQGGFDGRRGGRGGGGGGGAGRQAFFGSLSDDDRQKLRQMRQQGAPEDRKKLSDLMEQARGELTADQQKKLVEQIEELLKGSPKAVGTPVGAENGRAGQAGNPMEMLRRASSAPQFSEEDRKNAKLPLPPEEDSQVEELLRPGLLADVEIVVETIPNALHVPAQAVFRRDGRPTVFVERGQRFEPREVQLGKQSESLMVLKGGVELGDVVALTDPTADPSAKKGKGEKKSSANPLGSLPGGK